MEIDPHAMRYMPEEMITPEMALDVIERNRYSIRFIPKQVYTPEIALAVVKRGVTLEYVPTELQAIVKQELGIR